MVYSPIQLHTLLLFPIFGEKKERGRVFFVFCFAHEPPVAVPYQYCWQKFAEFEGRYWYLEERKKMKHKAFRAEPFFIQMYIPYTLGERKGMILNCRRVPLPPPQSTNKKTPHLHLIMFSPFFSLLSHSRVGMRQMLRAKRDEKRTKYNALQSHPPPPNL